MITIEIETKAIEDIELFVFDKDGTIIDLYQYWSKMAEYRANAICQLLDLPVDEYRDDLIDAIGIDLKAKQIKKSGPTGHHPRTIVQAHVAKYLESRGIKDTAQQCQQGFVDADEYSNDHLTDMIKPVEGVIEFLSRIKDAGCKLAIATSDKTRRAEITLEIMGIKELFDKIVGFDLVDNHKPAPDSLKLISETLNISPNRAVMIGDIYDDLRMGSNAGFKASIGLRSNIVEEDQLLELTPYVISNFNDIKVRQLK